MRILRIVTADENLADSLFTAFVQRKQFSVLPVVRDGKELLERYLYEKPDVLLIDLALPGIDGLEILDAIDRLPLRTKPMLFVLADYATGRMLELMRSKITYCFIKPFDSGFLAERIAILSQIRPPFLDKGRPGYAFIDYLVTQALFRLGVPPHLQGYHLLRESIKLVVCSRRPARLSVMKDIYPAAASLCGSTVSMAEHAMRHAIESAWMRAELSVLQQYFGYTVEAHKDTPSNSAFIHMVADRVRMQLDAEWQEDAFASAIDALNAG